MKTSQMTKFTWLWAIAVMAVIFSCSKDDLDLAPKETRTINHFIKENMDLYYLWKDNMPKLNPDTETDPKVYFNKLLFKELDHWSFITDDYQGLIDYFAGVQKSMGHSFQLYLLKQGSNKVIGIVEYVEPNSPADIAGIERGDIFYKINGTEITTENYLSLLNKDAYSLTLGTIGNDGNMTTTITLNLTAVELNTNPVFYYDIYSAGNRTVGYLVYNGFITNYEDDLKAVFAEFKSNGVNELVLDLRYNSGGAVSTANLLASMIGPSSIAGQIMIKNSYNTTLTAAIKQQFPNDQSWFEDRFITTPYNLNLNRLFVLTTSGTASASEMIIYSLKPYMNVVQIGSETTGKYYGSITISDEEKKHNWAIQPIIMRAENKNNSIDYTKGLLPNYEMDDDYWHQLGDEQEMLLQKALSLISGAQIIEAPLSQKSTKFSIQGEIKDAKINLNPHKFDMLINAPAGK
jgi:C-terminal processing protease CtpA/Prc